MNGTKHLIAIVCMLMMPLFLHAQSKSLFITFSDNTRAEFTLESQPEISFGDDMLKVKAGDQSVSYELKRVLTFTYGASTGVRQVESDMAFKREHDCGLRQHPPHSCLCHRWQGSEFDTSKNGQLPDDRYRPVARGRLYCECEW